jgi:hypothetical protein
MYSLALTRAWLWSTAAVLAVTVVMMSLAANWLALLSVLASAALVGWAAAAAVEADPPGLRLVGAVETFMLMFASGYVLLALVRPNDTKLHRVFYDGFDKHAEAAALSIWPSHNSPATYGETANPVVLAFVIGLVGWALAVSVLPPRQLGWFTPVLLLDGYLIWLVGRLVIQPVRGVPPIGLFEGGTYANLGVFTIGVAGGLVSLRLASVLGMRERRHARLGAAQAWLTVAVSAAMLVLLGRYVHRLGITPARLAGFLIAGAILVTALVRVIAAYSRRRRGSTVRPPRPGRALWWTVRDAVTETPTRNGTRRT